MKTRNCLFACFALALILVASLTSCDKELMGSMSELDATVEVESRCCENPSSTVSDENIQQDEYFYDYLDSTDSKNDKTEDE